MRKKILQLFLVVVISLSTSMESIAQTMMPLPAYGNTYTATQTRGYWFTAPTDFIITGLKVPTDVGTLDQYIQVMRYNAAPGTYPATTTGFTNLAVISGTPGTSIIPVNIFVSQGDVIGILGARGNSATMNNSYATPAGPFTSNILGNPVTLTRLIYQGSLFNGPATTVSEEVNASLARIEMYYTAAIQGTDNAAVLSIDSPAVYCAGSQSVYATIGNYGSNQIDSVTVNWEVNGVAQPSIKYIGLLDTLNGSNPYTAQVMLGSYTFPSGLNDLKVYTSDPNGVLDTFNINDTAVIKTGPSLNGNFTVNPAVATGGTNFNNILDMNTALNTFGICGPVTVTVSNFLYDNQYINLSNVSGLSSVNTLTIDGGDSSATIVRNNGNQFAAMTFDNVDYVTVRNMTFESTDQTGGVAALFNNANHNNLTNCELLVDASVTTSLVSNTVMSSSSTGLSTGAVANYNTIANNKMVGGYYGFYMYGSTTQLLVNNKIMNNDLDSVYYYGMYSLYHDSLEVIGNDINQTQRNNLNGDGAFIYYSNNVVFEGNKVLAEDYGAYFYNFNTYAPINRRYRIVNNMISSNTDWGVYMYYVDSVDMWHNSFQALGTTNPALQIGGTATKPVSGYDVRNNIFSSLTTEALETINVTDTIFIKFDNNVFNTTGSNLINIAGTQYASLTAYQTAQPLFNTASLEGDPQFASTNNLHIVGAFVNDNGDNSTGVMVDIDGDVRPMAGSTTVDIGADEFDPPNCPPPANLGSGNSTLTSVDIFWIGQGGSYQYEVLPVGSPQGSGTLAITSLDSVTVSGLTASTSYAYYVREICGRGDTSLWIGPFTFSTAVGVPFFEDFETFTAGTFANPWPRDWTSTTTTDPNWESEDANNGNNENSAGTGPLWDHTHFGGPTNGMYMYMETSSGTVGDTADFVSPPIYVDPSQNVLLLSYWYFNHGANIDRMDVVVDTNGVENVVASYVGQQQASQSDPWNYDEVFLTGYAGKSIQVKFRGVNVACCSGDIAIDDISVDVLPPLNAGVVSIINPQLPICPGSVTPVVGVKNLGTDTLNSVKVYWDINGTLDSVTYTGTILPGDTAAVTLNNVTFANGTLYDIHLYSGSPNNMVDPITDDDSLSILGLRTGLSGNFTIDAGAAASGTNWQSFTDFANDVNNFGLCGPIVVDVATGSGPYNDQVELFEVNGSNSTNTITINGHGETLAFGSTNTNQRAVLTFNGTSWVRVDSLNIDGTGATYGWGIQNFNGAHHIQILNSTIDVGVQNTSTFFSGIVNSGSRTSPTTSGGSMHDILIDNCTIIGGYYGITSYGNTSSPDQYNFAVTNCTIEDAYAYGTYFLYTDSVIVENNDISRPNKTSVTTFYGVYIGTSCEKVLVNANAIHNSHGSATSLTGTSYPMYISSDAVAGAEILVSNNLIYDINSNGTIYAIYDLGANYASYINNTISLDNVASSGGTTRGIYQSAASTNSNFINNVISITRGGSSTMHGIYLNSSATSMIVDYNDVYINNPSATTYYGYYGGNEATLLDWQTNTPNGTNSYDVDPKFVNPAIFDLTPSQGLINNVGFANAIVTSDYFGTARASVPDLGAIEFTPPASENLGITNFIEPTINADSCYGANEDVIVELINAGGVALDFTATPATITVSVSGVSTQSISTTINNNSANGGNPLAIGATLNLNVGSISMNTAGNYSLNGLITLSADTFPNNDTLSTSLVLPQTSGGVITGNDTICAGDTASLSADSAFGSLQWQVFSGGNWVDITGETGSSIQVNPSINTDYRVVACGTANSLPITVVPITLSTPTAIGDTVTVQCGTMGTAIGTVIANSGLPNPEFVWYDSAVAGNQIMTGGVYLVSNDGDSLSYTATPGNMTMPLDDTLWVAEVSAGGQGGPTLVISELDPGGTDMLEIQVVSSSPVDVTGWTVAVSNDYNNINLANTIVQTLSGTMSPNQTMYWTDNTATNYWGNNLFWNESGSPGWAIILDAQGAIVDFMAFEWSATDIMSMNTTIAGFTVTPGLSGAWIGNGAVGNGNPAGSSIFRTGSEDHDDATDWSHLTSSAGVANAGLITPFAGGNCESARVPVYFRVGCVVGISDLSNTEKFEVYPNPSNGQVTFDIETYSEEDFTIELKDVSGKVVFDNSISVNGSYLERYDLSDLAKGVYYLHIQTEDSSRIEKLVIQ